MRVVMRVNITGYRDGVPWPEVGGLVDVPDHEAEGLVANGYAEPAASVPEPVAAPVPEYPADPAPTVRKRTRKTSA